MSAFYGAGLAEGGARLAQQSREREMREEQLKTAKAQRQTAEQQLEQTKAESPERQSKADLLAYQTNSQLLQSQTYDALNRYDIDPDARHLNLFLDQTRNNPVGRNLFEGITRFDTLSSTQRTPEIEGILKEAGYASADDAYEENNPNMVIATGADGKLSLMDLDRLKGMSGYNRYATRQQLATQEQQARINQMLRGGNSYSKVKQIDELAAKIKEENGELTTSQAYKQAKSILDSSGGTADERMITQIMQEQGLGALEATQQYYSAKRQGVGRTNESQFIEDYMAENPGASRTEAATAYANRGKTSAQKELGQLSEIKGRLKDSGFFQKNLAEMTVEDRAAVHEDIAAIEDMRGVSLSTEDKRLARQFRDLTALGTTAGEEITDAETGLIDTMLNKVDAYISNEVGGKKGTSAYESFRNIFRNSLYGASLTKSEIDSFNKAMGTLGQQTKPVLAQLQTQMRSIKTQLESIRDTNDPYLAHYYFGSSIDDIDRSIEGIEQRLNMFSTQQRQDVKVKDIINNAPPAQDGADKPSLDDIFGGAN